MRSKRYKLRYLATAASDFFSLIDYIAKDNPRAANKMVDRLEKAVGRLQHFPLAGKVPDDDELRRRNYRLLIVGKYLVFYKIKEDAVEIHRIIHGARDYKHLLI